MTRRVLLLAMWSVAAASLAAQRSNPAVVATDPVVIVHDGKVVGILMPVVTGD